MGSSQSNTAEMVGYPSTRVEFEDRWFAKGSSRFVYRGVARGDRRVDGKPCVVKVYQNPWDVYNETYAWESDDMAYRKAQEMADLFNKECETSKPIKFMKPEFVKVDTLAAFNYLGLIPSERKVQGKHMSKTIPKWAKVAVEWYLEGDFVKFSSNTGYVHDTPAASPGAFSHFTYHRSNGEVLVCDLQGLRSNSDYRFTDPAILSGKSTEPVYGLSDNGKCGIAKFFESHKCNELCKTFDKPDVMFNLTEGTNVEFKAVLKDIPAIMPTFKVVGPLGSKVKQMQKGITMTPIQVKSNEKFKMST